MATKVTRESTTASSAPEGAEDMAVLHGELDDIIAGETLTFREYPHMVGLRLKPLWQPIVDALARDGLEGEDEALSIERVEAILADNVDALPALIGAACGKGPDWYGALGDEDGERAMHNWWAVNDGFFVRRVGTALSGLAMKKLRDGPTSTPN